jgi:hypothetical protein
VERDYQQLLKRRDNSLLGVAVGTGVISFGLLMPAFLAGALKGAAGILGGASIWSAGTNIWSDHTRFRGMPFWFAWKAHKLHEIKNTVI